MLTTRFTRPPPGSRAHHTRFMPWAHNQVHVPTTRFTCPPPGLRAHHQVHVPTTRFTCPPCVLSGVCVHVQVRLAALELLADVAYRWPHHQAASRGETPSGAGAAAVPLSAPLLLQPLQLAPPDAEGQGLPGPLSAAAGLYLPCYADDAFQRLSACVGGDPHRAVRLRALQLLAGACGGGGMHMTTNPHTCTHPFTHAQANTRIGMRCRCLESGFWLGLGASAKL